MPFGAMVDLRRRAKDAGKAQIAKTLHLERKWKQRGFVDFVWFIGVLCAIGLVGVLVVVGTVCTIRVV